MRRLIRFFMPRTGCRLCSPLWCEDGQLFFRRWKTNPAQLGGTITQATATPWSQSNKAPGAQLPKLAGNSKKPCFKFDCFLSYCFSIFSWNCRVASFIQVLGVQYLRLALLGDQREFWSSEWIWDWPLFSSFMLRLYHDHNSIFYPLHLNLLKKVRRRLSESAALQVLPFFKKKKRKKRNSYSLIWKHSNERS